MVRRGGWPYARAAVGGGGALVRKSALCTILVMAALAISALTALAQPKPGVDKLYILNCGEGVAGDISRWSPGVNVGQPMDFVDNCYLVPRYTTFFGKSLMG